MAKTVLYRVLQEDGGELLDVSKYLKAGDNASLQLKLTVWPSDEDGFRNPAGMSGALILPWSKEFEETVLLIIFPEMPNIHDQPSAVEVRSVILYGLNSVKRLSGMELVSTDSSHDSDRSVRAMRSPSSWIITGVTCSYSVANPVYCPPLHYDRAGIFQSSTCRNDEFAMYPYFKQDT